ACSRARSGASAEWRRPASRPSQTAAASARAISTSARGTERRDSKRRFSRRWNAPIVASRAGDLPGFGAAVYHRRPCDGRVGRPMASQEELHARSLADPDGFWGEAASAITWFRPFARVRDEARAPFVRWFPGGLVNTCHDALD